MLSTISYVCPRIYFIILDYSRLNRSIHTLITYFVLFTTILCTLCAWTVFWRPLVGMRKRCENVIWYNTIAVLFRMLYCDFEYSIWYCNRRMRNERYACTTKKDASVFLHKDFLDKMYNMTWVTSVLALAVDSSDRNRKTTQNIVKKKKKYKIVTRTFWIRTSLAYYFWSVRNAIKYKAHVL